MVRLLIRLLDELRDGRCPCCETVVDEPSSRAAGGDVLSRVLRADGRELLRREPSCNNWKSWLVCGRDGRQVCQVCQWCRRDVDEREGDAEGTESEEADDDEEWRPIVTMLLPCQPGQSRLGSSQTSRAIRVGLEMIMAFRYDVSRTPGLGHGKTRARTQQNTSTGRTQAPLMLLVTQADLPPSDTPPSDELGVCAESGGTVDTSVCVCVCMCVCAMRTRV